MMNLRTFMTAGNATFTVTSNKTGDRLTYKVVHADNAHGAPRYFINVLTGPDNGNNYSYIGMLTGASDEGTLLARQTKGSMVSATSRSWLGFVWLISRLNAYSGNGDELIARSATVHHEGRCGPGGSTTTPGDGGSRNRRSVWTVASLFPEPRR